MIVGRLSGSGLGRAADFVVTDRFDGFSEPPFDELNLSFQVGDDPASVIRNRLKVAAALGVESRRLVSIRAQHGASVKLIVSPNWRNRSGVARMPGELAAGGADVSGVDGLLTVIPGTALLALSADCAAVALADAKAGVVAVAHCGWPGLVAGILPVIVDSMRAVGASDINAVIGPAICGDCYKVHEARGELIMRRVPQAARQRDDGSYSVDIAAGAAAVLVDCGIRIVDSYGCSAHNGRFFSYRRDGRTGRQAVAVVLRADPPIGGV